MSSPHISYLLLYSKYSPGCQMLFQRHSDVTWESFCKLVSIDNQSVRQMISDKFTVVPDLVILADGKVQQIYQGLDDVSSWMDQVKSMNTQSNQTVLDLPPAPMQPSMMQQPRYDTTTSPPPEQVPKPTVSNIGRTDYTHIKQGFGHEGMAKSSLTPTQDNKQPVFDQAANSQTIIDDPQVNLDNPPHVTSLMADVTQELPDVSSHKNRITEGKKADIKSVVSSMAAERDADVELIENMDSFLKQQKK